MTTKQKQAIRKIVSTYFKDQDGKPFELTDGQCEIFEAIVNPKYKHVWISAPTRYGKSNILALGFIYLAVFHHLKIPIVAGTKDKADKIMEYIVKHIADHPELYAGLINLTDIESIEKLKIKTSKQALRWATGGWIYVTSIESRSLTKEGEGVVGEGGDVVVLEESGLIKKEEQFSKVVRMPEHNRGWGKLIQSGNCIEKSVFEKAYNDPKYHKVRISLEQAIAEGRFTREEIETKKQDTTGKDWKRYYLVEFPLYDEFAYFKPKKYTVLPNGLVNYGAIDLALGEAKHGSLTGIITLGRDRETGQIYEVDSIATQMSPDEAKRTILSYQREYRRFGVEAVQFQRYFLSTIKQESQQLRKHIPLVGIEQKRKKEERIESMEPYINTGQILFKGDNELWNEMQNYPESDNLDALDALEMCWRLMHDSGGSYSPEERATMREKDDMLAGGMLDQSF